MAKKKETQQQNPEKMAEEQEETLPNAETTPVTVEDNMDEKLTSLKSLNKILVNETAKNRQEISALQEDKKSLETELTRSESEADSLRTELTLVGDELKKIEDEKEELKRALGKNEEKVEGMMAECKGLKKDVDDLNGEKEVVSKENIGVRKAMEEKEGRINELNGVVSILRVECEGLKEVIEGLNGEKEVVLKENVELRKVMEEKERRINELGDEVYNLNAMVLSLKEDEEKWRVECLELEKSNVEVVEEFEGLKAEFGAALEEKKAKEREIESVVGEKLKNLERLGELEKEVVRVNGVNEEVIKKKKGLEKAVERLKTEFGALSEEKKEKERFIEDLFGQGLENLEKLGVLEKEIERVKQVNEHVIMEKTLLENVLEGLKTDFRVLLEEKKAKEWEIQVLVGEKFGNSERLGELEKENERVIHEKTRLEELSIRQVDEIRDLLCEMNEIQCNVLSLQESNRDQLENNLKLVFEINDYNGKLVRLENELDDVKRFLDEEKMNVVELQVKVSEISKKLEETENDNSKLVEEKNLVEKNLAEALEKLGELEINDYKGKLVRLENERDDVKSFLDEEKMNVMNLQMKVSEISKKLVETENEYSKLVEGKGLIEKNLAEAMEKLGELEGSLRTKNDMFESASSLLRNMAMELSKGDDGIVVNEGSVNGEMEAYMAELEAIRAVIRSKEDKVGEMKQEMENLQCCVVEAKKERNLWTLVSSSSTVLAAVLTFAYAARARER